MSQDIVKRYLPAVTVGLVAVVYLLNVDLIYLVGDDGAITLRYAERLAQGLGFGYDDTGALNGASNPLYAVVLAGLLRSGVQPLTAVLFLAFASYSLTVAIVFHVFSTRYGWIPAVFSALSVLGSRFLVYQLPNGLETPFTLLLSAVFLLTLHRDGDLMRGAAAGLLVANKLDGVAALFSVLSVERLRHRRFPWRIVGGAVVAVAPIFLFLLATFGSVIPNSVLVKAGQHAARTDMNAGWVVEFLMQHDVWLYLGLGSCLLVPWVKARGPLLILQIWSVVYFAAYSLIDLGAPYPWYLAPMLFLVILLASSSFGMLYGLTKDLLGTRAAVGIFLVALLLVGRTLAPQVRATLDPGPKGWLPASTWRDLARQAAGVWLRENTSGRELLATPWGFPAFEYKGPVIDLSGLSSTRDPERAALAEYLIIEAGPEETFEASLDGRHLVATFQYDAAAWQYGIYSRVTSEIWRRGTRRLPELGMVCGRTLEIGSFSLAPPERARESIRDTEANLLRRNTNCPRDRAAP